MSNETDPSVPPPDNGRMRRGLMLVLSSPSGAGKSTLAQHLLNNEADLHLSISVTTRARRGSEVEGGHYHFVSAQKFETMRVHGELLEWAQVHGNLYGTPREPVREALDGGRDVLFDIDYQGTLQLYEGVRDDVVSVFILPPSMAELRARLDRRAEDAPEIIDQRLKKARLEISFWDRYDYVIINSDLDKAYAGVRAILAAERLRRTRNTGLEAFTSHLRGRNSTA
jgi:guanylate kinase